MASKLTIKKIKKAMTLHLKTELIDNYKITFDPFLQKATHSVIPFMTNQYFIHKNVDVLYTNLLLKSEEALAKKRCILPQKLQYCSKLALNS
jgi:heme oxygenase